MIAAAARPADPLNAQYPCRECNKVFNRQERLLAHMAAHRPHRCSLPGCGKEFKFKAHLARHCAQAHGIAIRAGSPRPIVKTRAAFYLQTNLASKVARSVCSSLFKPRHSARKPFNPINSTAIKLECKFLSTIVGLVANHCRSQARLVSLTARFQNCRRSNQLIVEVL